MHFFVCLFAQVRLGDYGSAHSAHGVLVPEERTTPYCRSPERWLGQLDDSKPIDVWAVGVVALCLVRPADCLWINDGAAREWLTNALPVVGAITDATWPGRKALPGWLDVAGIVSHHPTASRREDIFGGPDRCAQIMDGSLRWNPLARCAAAEMAEWQLPQGLVPGVASGPELPPPPRGLVPEAASGPELPPP